MDPINDDTVHEFVVSKPRQSALFTEGEPPPAVGVGAATHQGKIRTENQDHFLVARRLRQSTVVLTSLPPDNVPSASDEAYLLLVADGVAGGEFGEVASRLVLAKLWELSGLATSWLMKLSDETSPEPYARVRHYVEMLRQAFNDARSDGILSVTSGTTCTCAYIIGWHAVIANIGDSRAYLFRDGDIRQVTRDHTVAQKLIDLGLPQDHAGSFGHMLTSYLGTDGSDVRVDINCLRLKSTDQLLVCSDGLTNDVSEEDIAAELVREGSSQEHCDRLLQLALDGGGHDNITLVLASVTTNAIDDAQGASARQRRG